MDSSPCAKSDNSDGEDQKVAQGTSSATISSSADVHEHENDRVLMPPHDVQLANLAGAVEAPPIVQSQAAKPICTGQCDEIEFGPPTEARDVKSPRSPQDLFSDAAGASSPGVDETEDPIPSPRAGSLGQQQDTCARDFQIDSSSVVTPSPTTSDEPLQFRDSSVSRSDTSSHSSPFCISAKGHYRSTSPPLPSAQDLSLSSPSLQAHEQGSHPLQAPRAVVPGFSRQPHDRLPPLQKRREVDDVSISLSDWNSEEADSVDLKDYYTDCDSDGDPDFGLGSNSLGSPSPPPRQPSTSRVQLGEDSGPQVSSLPSPPPASPGPQEENHNAMPDESPTRAGKRRAFSPPPWQVKIRKHRLVFDPPDEVKDLILTHFIDLAHWEQVDWAQIGVPSAVLARHGSDPRQRIRAYGLLWFARGVLALRGISRSWTRVIEMSREWLELLSTISRLSIGRLLLLAREGSGRREQLSPLGVFQSWLRERCLGCLLNNVNVDLRGLREGLSRFVHFGLGHINLCRVHIESCADCEHDEEPNMICHQCLMAPQRRRGERECRLVAVAAPPTPRRWMPNECSDCRHDYFMGQFRLAAAGLPRMNRDLYKKCPTYHAWISARKGGKNIHQVVNRVVGEIRRLAQKESCTCGICERQKRLREEEEESGAFGSVGRNGAGLDKRIKMH